MVVYDIYYLMVDKETRKVSGIWRVCHVLSQLLAAATGILCTWYFQTILYGFNKMCPLFATMEFSLLRPNSVGHNFLPKNVSINMRESNWGTVLICQYCLSTWMISFIAGIALTSFFLWSQRGGKGHYHDSFIQPWRHMYPALLVSIIMMIQAAVTTFYSANGFDAFCLEFQPYVDDERCNTLIDKFTLPICNKVIKIYFAMLMVRIGAPLCVVAWMFHTLSLIVRIILSPDFTVQMIKIVGIRRLKDARTTRMIEAFMKPVAHKDQSTGLKENDTPEDLLSHMSEMSDSAILMKQKRRRRKNSDASRSLSSVGSSRSETDVPRRSKRSKRNSQVEDGADDVSSPSVATRASIASDHQPPPKQSLLSRLWYGKQPKKADVEAPAGNISKGRSTNEGGTSKPGDKNHKKRPSIAFKDNDTSMSVASDDHGHDHKKDHKKESKDDNDTNNQKDKH